MANDRFRRIVVDGVTYVWRASGTDHGVEVVVALADAASPPGRAPRPSRAGQTMVSVVDHAHLVIPSVVRELIERALADGWRPGEPGRARRFHRRDVVSDPASPEGAAPRPDREPTEAALLAAIADARDDDAPRLVYADWLLHQEDPIARARGEYIALACASEPTPEARARAAELLAIHEPAWLGPIAAVTQRTSRAWSRGFLDACRLERHHAESVEAALGDPAWATVRTLDTRSQFVSDANAALLACQVGRGHVGLLIVNVRILSELIERADAPELDELAIDGLTVTPALHGALAAHPRLGTFRVLHRSAARLDELAAIARPGLVLAVATDHAGVAPWLAELAAERPPLAEVRLRFATEPFDHPAVQVAILPEHGWTTLELRWRADADARSRRALVAALRLLPAGTVRQVNVCPPAEAVLDPRDVAWRAELTAAIARLRARD